MPKAKPFLAAAVQAAPVYLDLAGTVAKTIDLIRQAKARDVELLAFPETWLPGYCFWPWLGHPAWGMQFVQAYHENSIATESPEMEAIRSAVADAGIHVVLGTSERDHGTLYIGQSIIAPDGSVIAHRRKLKPTHVERTVFGEGDGSDLAVHDTSLGRLGALCCWEHLQPLVKYAMYAQHEQIHVASWPSFALYEGGAYALGAELNTAVSQVYAAEGGCFVVAATAVVTPEMQAILCDTDERRMFLPVGGGRSMIFGPDGRPLADFIPHTEEGLVIAEIDLGLISLAKSAADPVGHYARRDVTRLLFNAESTRCVEPFTPGYRELGASSPPDTPPTRPTTEG
ncbi:carbon-nitrogen hydrolase family protein [Sphingobium fluviale]|uniref:Carbon-nitrogen hydrolase family protein n=1 Tax=Sphingobium fluviale TaxID=2506423 RepID=A0A4Q1KIU1_9SPHN|nr:carbon-nitrogen hydrolase family protein [Sphingobium fluviale]RXR29522.1 carbon-nitrogen hydrolase family protein [Sphingobium fluviale]